MDKETKQAIKKAVYLNKKSKSLDKKSDAHVTTEKFWDHFDGIDEYGKRSLVGTGIFGFLRSDELDDQRMRAKYRGGSEKFGLVIETVAAGFLDVLALPFTLAAGIVMNIFNLTAASRRIKNRASNKAKKVYEKKYQTDLELFDHLYKNNLLEGIKEYSDDHIRTSETVPFVKHWTTTDIQNLALQEKEKGNLDSYNEYKNLANALNENHCKYWNWDVESHKLKWEDEEKLADVKDVQNEVEQNEKSSMEELVDACKESGLTQEETLKMLKDAGYQQTKPENEKNEQKISDLEDSEVL